MNTKRTPPASTHAGARPMLGFEVRGGHGDLREVEVLHVVVAAPFQIAHEHVKRSDPLDAQRFLS